MREIGGAIFGIYPSYSGRCLLVSLPLLCGHLDNLATSEPTMARMYHYSNKTHDVAA